jgi:uncharacterized OB-fold protein
MQQLNRNTYFRSLLEGNLLGLKCDDCSEITAPPKSTCNNCGSKNHRVVKLSGSGTIKTFTVVRVAPEGLEAPYIVVMVELDEGPWLLGNLAWIGVVETTMELIGKRVVVKAKEVSFVNYSDIAGVVPIFIIIAMDNG